MKFNPLLWTYQTSWALFQLGSKEGSRGAGFGIPEIQSPGRRRHLNVYAGHAGASMRQPAAAEEEIQRATRIGKEFGHFHHTTYVVASAYALMNKPEAAVKWLQAAVDDGFPCYPLFERHPNLNNLREDPRFIALMFGLKDRWKHYESRFKKL